MDRVRSYALPLLLILVSASIFWPVRHYGFVWDDRVNVEENPHLKTTTLSEAVVFWKSPYKKLYIPLTYTAWAVLARFSALPAGSETRLDPGPFHVANVALHLLSVLVVFVILRRLVRRDWAAGCGALLFAVHPVQVEPVAWVTGMKDILSGLLSLVALWQYLLYAGQPFASAEETAGKGVKIPAQSTGLSARQDRGLHYAIATLAFVLALLAKPAAVVVPIMAWVLDYGLLKRTARQWALPLAVWVVIALPFVALTKWEQPDVAIGSIPSLWARPIVAGDALAFYLYKLVFPLWLALDYGRSPEVVLRHAWTSLTWVVPLGFLALVWRQRRRRPWLLVSAGLFVTGLLPVLGLIPFNFQNFSTVADRYLYLSLAGPALALSWSLSEGWGGKRGMVICALVLGFFAARSALQTRYWSDGSTLFRHVLRVNPNSWTAHYNLGNALERGDELDEAIRHYREALRIVPSYARAHNNLGIALERRGELEEAAGHYRRALAADPPLAEAHYNLGSVLAREGKLEEAVSHFRATVRLQPDFAQGHESLGRALALQGKREEAIGHMEKALAILRSRAGEGQ